MINTLERVSEWGLGLTLDDDDDLFYSALMFYLKSTNLMLFFSPRCVQDKTCFILFGIETLISFNTCRDKMTPKQRSQKTYSKYPKEVWSVQN